MVTGTAGTITVNSTATLELGLANGSTLGAPINNPGALVGIETSGVTNTISGVINTNTLTTSGGFTYARATVVAVTPCSDQGAPRW